jgi:putative thiamine transport system substrate-binding protein
MNRLLGDTEISIAMSFNPAEFASAIEQGILSSDVKSFIFEEGSLGNVHFVTIPYNASSPDAAKLVADFLLSPEAQLHKANIQIWGDPTVLDIEMLPANVKKSFKSLPQHPAMLTMQELQNVIPEPHPSWVKLIEEEWQKRYAAGS